VIWARVRHALAATAVDLLIKVAYRLNRRRARHATLQAERPSHARLRVPPDGPRAREVNGS
jgi:putative exporter of polyketide antibiotics